MKKRIITLLLSFLFISISTANAQTVGINTTDPNPLTELDIKNLIENNDTIPRGIMIPRLREAQRDAIDVTAKESANSLLIYNLDEDCYNYYSREAEEWQSLCGKIGKATIDQVFCNEIKVYGNYIATVQTTPSEYIVIPVNVSKIGQYAITINAMFDDNTSNAYSFSGSGEFLYTGKQYVRLTAQGIPTQPHFNASDPTVGDKLDIQINGASIPEMQCSNIVIQVTDALADYSILCGSAKVYGIYTVLPDKTNSDDNTHYIEISVNVNDITGGSAAGWSATTDTQNGLSFRGSGVFSTVGENKIKLYAVSGSKANTYEPIVLTLTAETKNGGTSCKVTVRPAFTRKKIVGIGTANTEYGYSAQAGGSRALLLSNINFGNASNSTVPMVATNTPTSTAGLPTAGRTYDYNAFEYTYYTGIANLQTAVNTKPDIIIMGYDHAWTTAYAQIALKYLNDGGIILDFAENNTPQYILNAIFGVNSINGADGTGRNYSQMASFPDPILDGPFKPSGSTSIGGLYLGGDTENRLFGFTGIPTSGMIVYGYNNASNPAVLRTTGQRYILFGEGGFLTDNYNRDYTSGTIKPFAVDSQNRPMAKPAAGWYTYPVYNSFFFANAIAWAVEQAQFYGVNAK